MAKTKIENAPKAHAKYSASSSYRWLACPGSVRLSHGLESPESSYAKEGTDAHTCLETILKNGPEKRLATEAMLRNQYPHEMVLHAGKAAATIWKLRPKGAELRAETKADLSHIHPEMWGTFDAAAIEHFGRLYVIDFKFGAGIAVDPEHNPQLIFYALGLAHEHQYNFESIHLVIIQPRAPHPRGAVREWVTDVETLLEWAKKFRAGVRRTEKENAPLKSGDHCRFCPAASTCPELSSQALAQAQIDFAPDTNSLTLPAVVDRNMTLARLGATLAALEQIEIWAKAVREHAFAALKSGHKVPGWKLVEKRGVRKWVDAKKAEKAAFKKFGAKVFHPQELLSPAQLEVVVGKEWVSQYTATVSSGLTLAPESDNRQGIDQIANDFGTPVDSKSGKPKAARVKRTKGKASSPGF